MEAMNPSAPGLERKRPRYIAVEGPIGAGKSSLAEILSAELGARLVCENPGENPFLGMFYRDPKRFALSTQLFFLLQRYGQQSEFLQTSLFEQGGIVSDYLFAKDRLFASLTLSAEEMTLYDRVYQALRPRVAIPDLVVYLQARTEVLLSRIDKRGRPEEKPIKSDYVREVARSYAEFFFSYDESPLLIVDASEIDFVGNADDRAALLDVISKTRSGINHWSRR
jgi:deoxyadenosine/deoxycytidine kinase